MIEVEKKFQPTPEQLKNLLEGSVFLGEVVSHDIYYDYLDYRLFKKEVFLRNRNGNFELKIYKSKSVAEEIENDIEILKYFGVDGGLNDFVKENLVPIIEYKTKRLKYKKEGFNLDLDETDFGNGEKYTMCEIELMIENEDQIKDAEEKIINFAKKYGFENQKAAPKRKQYLKRLKPDIYKEVYEK